MLMWLGYRGEDRRKHLKETTVTRETIDLGEQPTEAIFLNQ